MMVVSDTSVVSNLLLIGELELLHHLFREVIVPDAVQQEVLALAEFGIDLKPYLQADWIKVWGSSDRRSSTPYEGSKPHKG